VLGVVVGALLLVINARALMIEGGTPGPVRLATLLALGAVGLKLAWYTRARVRAERIASAAALEGATAAAVAGLGR
jgi:hypothetical protein